MKKTLVTILFLFIISHAFANPLLQRKTNNTQDKIQQKQTITTPSLVSKFGHKILLIQKNINSKISQSILKIKKNKEFKVLFWVLLISFFYGAIHALGPGHGKVIISSYFLSRNAKFIEGIWMGLQTALTHGLSSIIYVLVLDFVIRAMVGSNETYYIKLISYSMIMAIGFYMFIRTVLLSIGKIHSHSHEHQEIHNKERIILSFFTGIVPCSGSMLILFYTMSYQILWLGILIVLTISLGIAATLIGFSFLSILMRKHTIEKGFGLKNKEKFIQKIEIIFKYIGSVLIILIGSCLFFNLV